MSEYTWHKCYVEERKKRWEAEQELEKHSRLLLPDTIPFNKKILLDMGLYQSVITHQSQKYCTSVASRAKICIKTKVVILIDLHDPYKTQKMTIVTKFSGVNKPLKARTNE